MTWITELIGLVLVVGSLVLLWAGRIDYQQTLTLIGIGIGLITGKQLSRLDQYLTRRYGHLYIMRKYSKFISAISIGDKSVVIHLLPEFINTDKHSEIMSEVLKLFPGKHVVVMRGERIRAV
jgi:hypothetical protein